MTPKNRTGSIKTLEISSPYQREQSKTQPRPIFRLLNRTCKIYRSWKYLTSWPLKIGQGPLNPHKFHNHVKEHHQKLHSVHFQASEWNLKKIPFFLPSTQGHKKGLGSSYSIQEKFIIQCTYICNMRCKILSYPMHTTFLPIWLEWPTFKVIRSWAYTLYPKTPLV